MAIISVNNSQKKVLHVLILLVVIFGFVFLKPYIMLIIFSAIMATLFNPVNAWLLRKGKSKETASFYTFVVSMLVIIIPLIIVLTITFFQVSKLVDTVSAQDYSVNLTDLGNQLINSVNDLLSSLGINYQFSIDGLADSLSNAVVSFGSALFQGLLNSFSSFFGLITAAIIYIYVFLSMLKNRNEIINTVKRLNPLGDEISTLYIERIGAMIKATVRGQFIIAFMQGFVSAAVLAVVGPSGLFFFFLLLLTVVSIIPLGAGIITIPIGIIMILAGNVWQGVAVIANHLIIVTNIDNVMRPKLVPRNARLDPALMILAVFSGMALFGFLGIVIGPVIMILLVTTLQIHNEVFYSIESIDRSKTSKKPSTFSKFKNKVASKN